MKTDFILTYDKSRKEDALVLEALVSEIANCKMVVYDTKKSMNLQEIDKQKWLFLGECSSHLKFKSKFDSYGIQIGWRGEKSWIRANPYSLLNQEEEMPLFISSYKRLYEKYELENKDKLQEVIPKSLDLLIKYSNFHRTYWDLLDFLGIAEAIAAREVRFLQYTYATLLFVDEYIKSFLAEQPKDAAQQRESFSEE